MAPGPGSVAIWSAAMVAMMLPSELPLLRLDHRTAGSWARTGVLTAGYAAVWLAVGLASMKLPVRPPLVWTLLALVLYQVTPLKRRCLRVCRAPLARVLHGWRDGLGGAFVMGVENGLWCLGCCVGFTALLVALGMKNVVWIAVVGGVILLEKAGPWTI
jgi:predicted metal-binding membrane protein